VKILVPIEKKKTKNKHDKHQHNTDEGGQAMGEDINIITQMIWWASNGLGEELRRVQVSR